LSDRVSNDAKLGAVAPRMHKADGRRFRIDDVNGATVSDVNAERNTALIGDNAVAPREFAARRAAATTIDRGDLVSVDLFRGKQRPIAESGRIANFSMSAVKPL